MMHKISQLQDVRQWLARVIQVGAEVVSDSRRVKPGDVFFAYLVTSPMAARTSRRP